jgi:hypothetical protein
VSNATTFALNISFPDNVTYVNSNSINVTNGVVVGEPVAVGNGTYTFQVGGFVSLTLPACQDHGPLLSATALLGFSRGYNAGQRIFYKPKSFRSKTMLILASMQFHHDQQSGLCKGA